MNFPEQYVKRGKFKLHSGGESNILYDVNSLLTNKKYLDMIINSIPETNHYIGIAAGGASIALAASIKHNSSFSMIKDGEFKGNFPEGEWTLIDDVTTTENSLREALRLVGSEPKEIFLVIDRRREEEKKLNLTAMFEV